MLSSVSRATPSPSFCLSCPDLLHLCRLCRAHQFLHLCPSMHIKWKLIVSFLSCILFWKVSALGEVMRRSNIMVRATGLGDGSWRSNSEAHAVKLYTKRSPSWWVLRFFSLFSLCSLYSTCFCVLLKIQPRSNPYLAIWHVEWTVLSATFLHKSWSFLELLVILVKWN